MKRFLFSLAIVSLIAVTGCDDSGSGTSTGIKVTASFSAAAYNFGDVDSTEAGTGTIKILVWNYSDNPTVDIPDGRTNVLKTGTIDSNGGSTTIELDAGNYIVLAMYDYVHNNTGPSGKEEYYIFYDGQIIPGDATAVTVTAGQVTEVGPIALDDSYAFSRGSGFAIP